MENIRAFLLDLQEGNFKIQMGTRRLNSKEAILSDPRYDSVKKFFDDKYVNIGMGMKSMINDFSLPITYSVLRNALTSYFDIELKSSTKANSFLRKRRSKNAKIQAKNGTGAYAPEILYNIKTSKTARGVQGYYYNKSMNKYVWLRSSWEYIYAKWLDLNGIIWDSEVQAYDIGDNIFYRPDFFIYNDGKLEKIVEIKGYWKSRKWKFYKLKELVTCETILIEDISSYTTNERKDFKEWKKIKGKKLI